MSPGAKNISDAKYTRHSSILSSYIYKNSSFTTSTRVFHKHKYILCTGRSIYARQSAPVAPDNNGRTGYILFGLQDKAVDIQDLEAAGRGVGHLGDRDLAVIPIARVSSLLELQDLVVLQGAPCNTDTPVAGWDDISVPQAVLDVGEPHTTAFRTIAVREQGDADFGGALAESHLGTDPGTSFSFPLERVTTAGDGDCVARNLFGEVDATSKSLGDTRVDERSAEGAGDEESGREKNLGKHFARG